MDGRGSDVTIQFGNPDEVDGTTDVPSYSNQRYAWVNGNNGITCMDLKGDLRDFDQSDQDDALNFLNPETTDGVEIWGGANYYISRNTFTNFSDEAQSSVHITGTPTAITQAYNYFYMNRQVSIVGSMTAPENSIGTITQAYNWSDHTLFGRTPGIYRNMHAHVYNNVSEDYTSNGIQAWNNSEVISECNVLTPEPLGSLRRGNLFNTSGTPGVPGKLNDTGSFVSGGGGDFFYSEPLTNMFTIPYSYTKLAGTTQASIESYVKENAGSDACPTLNFCV